MGDAVEIYVCLQGQALKDGKVEYSQSIYDKHGAEADAKARVARNPKIHKIAYYRVNDAGDFRIFYSFTNTALNAEPDAPKQVSGKRKAKPKLRWWQKLLGLKPKSKPKPKRKQAGAKKTR